MKKLIRLAILILLTISSINIYCQKNNLSLNDALGREIIFEKTPERVIALAPSLTEFMFLLECESSLVGNTLYCNYPPAAEHVEKVGDMLTFDYEKILSLNPDLILITVEGNTKESFDKIESFGLKTFVLNPRNFSDIKNSIKMLSLIFDKEEKADGIVNSWDNMVSEIVNLNKTRHSNSSMVIIDVSPLMLAGKSTFINEYLEFCNLTNIAENSPSNYPVFSREEVIKSDPDIIIYPGDESTDINYLLSYYPEWKALNAVKNNRVIFVNRDSFSRPGPRFVEALKELSSKIN